MRLAIILIFISSLSASAQSLQKTYELGKAAFERQDFSLAESSFKRVLFFDENEVYTADVNLKLAHSLYASGKYEEANYYYDLAYFQADESLKTGITLQKVSCYLLLQNYSYARIELYNLPNSLSDKDSKTARFYEAMLEFAEGNFANSKELFKPLSSDTLALAQLFEKNEKIEKLNPKTAKVLSIIIPGLGQMYAGNWKAGINSLVLTGGLFYLGINSAIQTTFMDAMISVLPWFQRYYTGGFKKAEQIAIAKKQERRYEVFNEILQVVENPETN